MELTNPINNQDMVDGIGKVMHAILKAELLCEQVLARKPDSDEYNLAEVLAAKHKEHIALLSDAMLYLGGAPNDVKQSSAAKRPSSNFLSTQGVQHHEEKIVVLCNQQIRRLTGSDEVAEKLNIVKEDIDAALNQTRHQDLSN